MKNTIIVGNYFIILHLTGIPFGNVQILKLVSYSLYAYTFNYREL